ncbi:aldehyde dehydrogenase [Fusarium coicis]|nr:aldehyde dehydrogenase [Fusarium coicis]
MERPTPNGNLQSLCIPRSSRKLLHLQPPRKKDHLSPSPPVPSSKQLVALPAFSKSSPATAQQALRYHMCVKKVSFTGSVPVGEKVLAAAAASDVKRYVQVKEMVDRALEQGDGKLFTSGKPVSDKGFWFPLTGFIEVAEESEIATKEIFGPVSVIMKFKDEGEVIVRANNSENGPALDVFTRHIHRALRIA